MFYEPLQDFHLIDYSGEHVGTIQAPTYKDALNEAFEGYQGKLSKSFISEHLITNDEASQVIDWKYNLMEVLRIPD